MQKLLRGICQFQSKIFNPRRDFFNKLIEGQKPQALFITCSDSRMVPDLICQTDPGDLFVVRNAGNIVPPYFPGQSSGETATIEYAIKGLGVKEIIVCGHTRCGALAAVAHPELTQTMPHVRHWVEHARAGVEIMERCYAHIEDETAQANILVQENVLVQLEHLRTHPAVAAGIAAGQLRLHAWVYKMETGDVFAYDNAQGQFSCISEQESPFDESSQSATRTPVRQPANRVI